MADDERGAIIDGFLRGLQWGGAQRAPIPGDASFRHYQRLILGDACAILMDAPPPDENVRPFVRMARHLRGLGYSAPEIYGEDAANGLLLIEDLGDGTFSRVMADGGDAQALYTLAVDLLIDLHRRPESQAVPANLSTYDENHLLEETFLLTDWYMPAIFGRPTPDDVRATYRDAWQADLPALFGQPRGLVLRDFFADNLMWLAERPGTAACGLLDFQDAVRGPGIYDLISLLEDERRDIDPDMRAALRERYQAAFPDRDGAAFNATCALLGAQRHAKNIGIFTRLNVRDGKAGYLEHIPRMWGLLEQCLRHPCLDTVAAWLDRHIPPEVRGIPIIPDTPHLAQTP